MPKKRKLSPGPNIPFWALSLKRGMYIYHYQECGGRIVQPTRKSGRDAVGRARCAKCSRFLGKKAERTLQELRTKGWVMGSTVVEQADFYIAFLYTNDFDSVPEPPEYKRPFSRRTGSRPDPLDSQIVDIPAKPNKVVEVSIPSKSRRAKLAEEQGWLS